MQNIGNYNYHDIEWQMFFSIICWLLWKNRNMYLFSIGHSCGQEIMDTSISWARSYKWLNMARLHDSSRVTTNQWACPTKGWVKLNTDGAVSRNNSFAGIGGVFRSADDKWLGGFSMKLGNDSIFKIEGIALLEGLLISWRKSHRQLEVECDNALLVELILACGVTIVI